MPGSAVNEGNHNLLAISAPFYARVTVAAQ